IHKSYGSIVCKKRDLKDSWRVPLCRNLLFSVATERDPPKNKSSYNGNSLRRLFLAQLFMMVILCIKDRTKRIQQQDISSRIMASPFLDADTA
ncbi:MAG TPA: hypothetical protein DCZ95_14135, partial [Verrucomicrobia bacterium]|nr:hypothetical protein [Verrucomicrobiota bacterium]